MIWFGIIVGITVGPWTVIGDTKITTDDYVVFIKDHRKPWLKILRITFRRTIVFM